MRLIRLADCPEVPWANGRGVTRQLLRDGAEPDPWTWRLSVATVSEPGPFSSLPGVDRILVCVGDAALPLIIDGEAHHAQPGRPIAFPGEADVVSLGNVATRDVNVMVRRDSALAVVAVLEAGQEAVHDDGSDLTAFISLRDDTVLGHRLLAIGDTVVTAQTDPRGAALTRGSCLRVAIHAARPRPTSRSGTLADEGE